MTMSTFSKRGFTLIELLVVIAIIAILAAILFPVFASAREKARQTTCASNLKQLGLAFTQYEQDYDEMVPCGNQISSGNVPGWAEQVYPYVQSVAVYACPDDTTVWAAVYNDATVSYSMNVALLYNELNHVNQPFNLAKMNAPSSTVLLVEVNQGRMVVPKYMSNPANWCSGYANGYESPVYASYYQTGLIGGRAFQNASQTAALTLPRHTQGANYLACDNHVKYLIGSQVSGGTDNTTASGAQGVDGATGSANAFEAAGTSSMTDSTGNARFQLTFSGI
jgi:prepilin-type N-terminal cleavage/methylation domain-containing protein/prepilin-type processing-associated H-X9-DG protein